MRPSTPPCRNRRFSFRTGVDETPDTYKPEDVKASLALITIDLGTSFLLGLGLALTAHPLSKRARSFCDGLAVARHLG